MTLEYSQMSRHVLRAAGLSAILAIYTKRGLRLCLEPGVADLFFTSHAQAVCAAIVSTQGGVDTGQAVTGVTASGLHHALLLHGIHTREPADRLLEADWLGPVAGVFELFL